MSTLTSIPKAIADSNFVCDCDERVRIACVREPFYEEYKGKRYCVLHLPIQEKSADFKIALKRKLDNKDFVFNGVWFPDELSFRDFDFNSGGDFTSAIFNAKADFGSTTFDVASFSFATFRAEAKFGFATFKVEANFSNTTFSENADFFTAAFGSARFIGATFEKGVDFRSAIFDRIAIFSFVTFEDYVKFEGHEHNQVFRPESSLSLEFARFKKPDHVSFHTLRLRPHWFVHVDARKFDFTNVDWYWQSTKKEIRDLMLQRVSLPYRMLSIACQYLAANEEESHRYENASRFRYLAMDARRQEILFSFGFSPWRLSWWYWLTSGYGERVFRAFLVLIGIWLISALLYTWVGFARWEPKVVSESEVAIAKHDEVGMPLRLSRALTYSLGVMTLQKPEPRPATPTAQTLVTLETIFGAVQAALLALAIRRKFMR